jgi:hypothetical protein
MAEPVISWISAPKLVSSCGGRPTTVNGQMASLAVVDPVHAHHREGMDERVVAQVVAERPFRLHLVRVDGAGDHEVGVGRDAEAFSSRK